MRVTLSLCLFLFFIYLFIIQTQLGTPCTQAELDFIRVAKAHKELLQFYVVDRDPKAEEL